MYHSFLIQSSADRHLGCFHVLAIINSAVFTLCIVSFVVQKLLSLIRSQYASKFGKLSSGHRTGKGQFSFQSPKQSNAKECSSYCKIALISHASKVMLKILQPRLQQYVNQELPDVHAGFR